MEDKIDLEIGGWEIFGIQFSGEHDPDEDNFSEFKDHLASPPAGQKDKAWSEGGLAPLYGSFFCRPGTGKDRNKMKIRKRAVIDAPGEDSITDVLRTQEPPLCGGYALIYKSPNPCRFTGLPFHKLKLRLSLNLPRFIRHQPQSDDPRKPWKYRLRKRAEDRSFHGSEGSFDDQDNWLPSDWDNFAGRDHLSVYLNLIKDHVGDDLNRSLKWLVDSKGGVADEDELSDEKWQIPPGIELLLSYWLKKVETFWEFPSSDPIGDVWKIGEKLIHFHKKKGTVKLGQYESFETGRIVNSPCFSIPLASSISLKVYAKTNKRIRFEIVQKNLGGKQSGLLSEAGLEGKDPELSHIPKLMTVLRKRAASQMNRVMAELRIEAEEVNVCSIFDLFAEIAAAIPPSFLKADRSNHIRNLTTWLCLYGGYRGNVHKGPYELALGKLIDKGVLAYDPTRQFYRLTDPYRKAAKDFVAAVGDPLVRVFGEEASNFEKGPDGESVVHLRE